jgi:hypothetical protein
MADAILPTLDDIVARGIKRLLARRAGAGPFVISGRYFDVFAGWRSQLVLLRQRLADEVAARRLPTAEGRALVELAASEFFAELLPEAATALGEIALSRPMRLDLNAGVIKEGTRFKVVADPAASPPVKQVSYVTTEPAYVAIDQRNVTIPIRATASGVDANLPRYEIGPQTAIVVDDTLFDPTFVVDSGEAAGGSSGVHDGDIRRLAKALYAGQHAPTEGALVAGALTDAAVKHVVVVRDRVLGQSVLYIADESWAWSLAFQNQCKQILKDTWLGWGARLDVRPIHNRLVALRATVVLADPKFRDDTGDLRSIIRAAVRRYLDERPDFYTFDLNAIGGTIASADERLLTCTSVELVNLASGLPVSPEPIYPGALHISRFFLTDNAVTLTLTMPS